MEADDSAGRALAELPAGTLLLAVAAAMAESLAPVPLLTVLKHPLVGGVDEARLAWLEQVRLLDLALRGPRPAPGIEGLTRHFQEREHQRQRGCRGCLAAWEGLRPTLALLDEAPAALSLAQFATRVAQAAEALAGDNAWRGQNGRIAAELLADLQGLEEAQRLAVTPEDGLAILRQLLEAQRVRPPYGGHPRVFIWGLLEARLQQADLMILGGLNEGVWPAAPAPDPWLAPKIRANLGLPGLEYRIGLSAHDFASALGAPEVLITRARRDGRSPTVASRFWLRLKAMTGGLPHDIRLERLAVAVDDMGMPRPVDRPQPCPPVADRPKKISVTSVDRLKADPFAFYAREMLKLSSLDPVDADHSAAWKGTAVHAVLEQWLAQDRCDPDRLLARARALLADQAIHPMLRALWQPRLMEAIRWVEGLERANQAEGRLPLAAEKRGEATIAGVTVYGTADRIDRLSNGGIAIVDYKTGKPPAPKAIEGGFALQLGLLGLIAQGGGFKEIAGAPDAHEYWSLTKYGDKFGRCVRPDAKEGADAFLERALRSFTATAGDYLTGEKPFVAKLNPAFAPYGDYDQLMRLEEWYGRS
ncbi:double-strand break repair protein AddB [Sphingomonas sinipercae]|uniref:double-strand break repair protein AddB n=1 Tax=Sphingomonas sinipercae TaxID=2714944 RepID=UPI0031B5E514